MLGAIIGGALALGDSLLSSKSQKKSVQKAADTSLAVAQQNNALARDIYGQNKGALSPFMERGNLAGGQINALLGLGGDQAAANQAFDAYRGSTGYNFRLTQGRDASNAGYAGSGLLQSGAALRGLEDYRQNLASSEFGNYLGHLSNQQGVGLAGASALAGVGNNYVSNVSANNNAAGTAAANAALVKGQNNPFANALGMVGGTMLGRVFA